MLYYYDAYIQEANDLDKYKDGWSPVCVSEFYMCDYEAWKNNSEHGTDKVYEQVIYVDKAQLDRLNYLVEQTSIDFDKEGLIEDTTFERLTARFPDGKEMDVKVCAGQTNCFIDVVLFDKHGHEVSCSCADSLGDEFELEDQGCTYIVNIKEV